MTSPGPVRLDSLTSLRFVAALIVVLSHTTRDLVSVPVLSTIAANGTVGVGFFFALSGFVLTWSLRGGDSPLRFYRRRFARIYPMHVLTYLLAFPVLLIAGLNMTGASVNWKAAIASPLLLQAWFPQGEVQYGMNAPSWSLSNEAFFYLLFPVVIPLLRRLPNRFQSAVLIAIPVIVATGTVLYYESGDVSDLLYLSPAWRLLGFVAGAALALRARRKSTTVVRLKVALASTVGVYVLLPVLSPIARATGLAFLTDKAVADAIMLPLFLLLIAAAARSDLEGTDRWVRRRWFVRLGEWSFALYLTHWLLIDTVVGILPGVRVLPPGLAVLANVIVVVLAVMVSGLFYRGVERPLERRLRGARPRSEQVLPPGQAAPSTRRDARG